jgi:protein SCO1/2
MGATGHTATAPARGKNGKWVMLGVLVILVVVTATIAIPTLTHARYTASLDDFGAVPSFAFTDDTGAPFATERLRGHTTVVNFIFTRCDTVCPASTGRMLEVQERTVDLGDQVALASFSVDPEYDTPQVLAAYGRNYHADPRRWRFVTGPLVGIKAVIEGAFMTAMDRKGTTPQGNPDIWHGQHFLLVDRDLHIRGIYDTDAAGLDRLVRDARYLARMPVR